MVLAKYEFDETSQTLYNIMPFGLKAMLRLIMTATSGIETCSFGLRLNT
jgi:hypothetical protein